MPAPALHPDQQARPVALRAAVLGHPIQHSKSPALHTAAYQTLNVPLDYTSIDLTEDQLPEFMDKVRSSTDWAGFSVTMPLKGAMVGHMHELSDRVRRLGFLNTVVCAADGTLTGYNTDVDGIINALLFAGLNEHTYTRTRMGILGAGGTAAAALESTAALGFTGVDLLVRTPAKAAPQRELAEELGLDVRVGELHELGETLPSYQAVISTLPPRAADAYTDHVVRAATAETSAVAPVLLDVAYDPWPSALADAWDETFGAGHVVTGLEMLLYQAVEQAKLFTGRLLTDTGGAREAKTWHEVTENMARAIDLPSRGVDPVG